MPVKWTIIAKAVVVHLGKSICWADGTGRSPKNLKSVLNISVQPTHGI